MSESRRLLTTDVRYEEDVVAVRQRTRQIAGLLGFSNQEQTSLATAVSEVVRNAFRYGGGGRCEFSVRLDVPQTLTIRTTDSGPGIGDLDAVLSGRYVSKTGMGLGLIGSKRLCDAFDVETAPGRTVVTLGKHLPRRTAPLTPEGLATLIGDLSQRRPLNAIQEVQEQNKDLLQTLEALRVRQAEVERLNAELAETNRGVVALYSELDDRAESLRRASEYKSRFLSDMTHELRTPLNAVISLSQLLLERADGDLTAEQEKQVTFIHRSATSLGDMVNDLLDLAKIESGRLDVRPARFAVADLLAAVRGMFRPLLTNPAVELFIDEPTGLLTMHSDEQKLAQILRNLVSNALKFTERGSVRLSATAGPGGAAVFTVADTGIGIASEHFGHIFEQFTQIDGKRQRQVKGTGLGLPLSRRLAELLGGDVLVESTLGSGTTFTVTLPVDLTTASLARPSDTEDQSGRVPAGGLL